MSNLKTIAEHAHVSIITAYQALRGNESIADDVRHTVRAAADAHDYTLHVTIRDVAALAGVSVGTVSHVLNDSPLTTAETRARVLQAINDLEYRRNSLARGLKLHQSHLIGYAWHRADDPIRRNALLDQFLYDIAQAAEARGYHILTFAQAEQASTRSYEDLIHTTRVDGFVLSDVDYNDARIHYLAKTGVPFVAFGQPSEHTDVPSVDVDGQLGMRLVVEHLVARGHRRIGLLCWPEGMRLSDQRVHGYRAALATASIAIDSRWVGYTRNAVDQAAAVAQQLLATTPPPTAIVCANDVMALGVMRAVEEAGLTVGGDVAVTGYDDTPVAELLQLTSVRQPIPLVASNVIDMLVAQIHGTPLPLRKMVLAPSLIIRSSSGPAR